MALPVIIVDSNTGSDTTSSGAGPGDGTTAGSALSGTTNASTDGAGTTVTLPAGTDLSAVLTDGSHAIFLNDSTAGARNFGKITGAAGSGGATPTVTVADAFGLTLSSKSWAIGGKRASLGGTTSSKLISNNSASGDLMPGWVAELQSAHSETISATLTCRRSGDTTDGPITIRGASGAATLPKLIFSSNSTGFNSAGVTGWVFQDFELQNSNVTKTSAFAFQLNNGSTSRWLFRRLKISDGTNKWGRAFDLPNHSYAIVVDTCYVGNCTDVGIRLSNISSGGSLAIKRSEIFSCTSHGIAVISGNVSVRFDVRNCIIRGNGGDGINDQNSNASGTYQLVALGNTFDGNTSDGIEIASATATAISGTEIENNVFSNNGGYGVNFSGSQTTAMLNQFVVMVNGNAFYNNTAGKYPAGLTISLNEQTTDPQYTNAAGGDYSIGNNMKAVGVPVGGVQKIGAYGNTYSFTDIGAAQARHFYGAPNPMSVSSEFLRGRF